MSWSNLKGFNFRATSGYVTDGTNETYVLAATTYPTTRTVNGEAVTFGWESGTPNSLDRSTAAGDTPELSGIGYNASGSGVDLVFRVDLPAAGTYTIRMAGGDAGGNNISVFQLKDTTTVLINQNNTTGTGIDGFYDAALNLWSSGSAWKSSNVAVSQTFGTTILRVAILQEAANNVFAHLEIAPPAAPAAAIPLGGPPRVQWHWR